MSPDGSAIVVGHFQSLTSGPVTPTTISFDGTDLSLSTTTPTIADTFVAKLSW